jgi:hypothetical protein
MMKVAISLVSAYALSAMATSATVKPPSKYAFLPSNSLYHLTALQPGGYHVDLRTLYRELHGLPDSGILPQQQLLHRHDE